MKPLRKKLYEKKKLTLSVVLERLGLSVPEVSEELLVLADMAITGKEKKEANGVRGVSKVEES